MIETAARWYLPPWKVAGGTKTLWYARQDVLRELEIKLAEKQKREMKRQRK